MEEAATNPYLAPSSDLVSNETTGSIKSFKRFSAWGVFGLSFITFGLYPVYWLCSRATKANSVHERPVRDGWLVSLVLATALSFGSGFLDASYRTQVAGLLISLVYMLAYLVVLFKLKNRLQDIIDGDSVTQSRLSPVLTFFFSTIYLQYKINEAIDGLRDQRSREQLGLSSGTGEPGSAN